MVRLDEVMGWKDEKGRRKVEMRVGDARKVGRDVRGGRL